MPQYVHELGQSLRCVHARMHMRACVGACTCVRVGARAHACVRACTCVRAWARAHACVRGRVHMRACRGACTCVRAWARAHACVRGRLHMRACGDGGGLNPYPWTDWTDYPPPSPSCMASATCMQCVSDTPWVTGLAARAHTHTRMTGTCTLGMHSSRCIHAHGRVACTMACMGNTGSISVT